MPMYTSDQVEEMSREAEAVAELFRAVDDILNPVEPPPEDKIEPSEEVANVIHVDFSLKREFEKAQNMPLKLPQLITIYHDWAFRSYAVAIANKHRLHNKKIREMVELNHAIVATIRDVMPKPSEK